MSWPLTMIPAFLNPEARRAAAAWPALRRAGGFDIREALPAALARGIRAACDAGAERVLVAGGDGSVGVAAEALHGSSVELAILPCGTLNHLARDLELPLDLDAAARVARDGSSVSIGAAMVNDHVFLSTSSVGAYVKFVRLRERFEHRLGYHVASLLGAARLLYHLPLVRVTVDVGNTSREYLTPLVFVGVGERDLQLRALGARVPNGAPGLHLMIVRRRSGARVVALGLAAAARGVGAVAETPAMDTFLVDRFRIETRTHSVAADGEIVHLDPPFEYRYLPHHLSVVVAPSARDRAGAATAGGGATP